MYVTTLRRKDLLFWQRLIGFNRMSRPPLRWVGGKQRYAETVARYLRQGSECGARYFEPFLGGGSVFWAVRPTEGVLGDVNRDLVGFYRYLAETPVELWNTVKAIGSTKVDVEAYYEARAEFNEDATGLR